MLLVRGTGGLPMKEIKAWLLKDKDNNYVTLTNVESDAFRFENITLATKVAEILGLQIIEQIDDADVKETSNYVNNW